MIRTRPLMTVLLAGALLAAGQGVSSARAADRDQANGRGRARQGEPRGRHDRKLRRDLRQDRREERQWDRRDARRDDRRSDRHQHRRDDRRWDRHEARRDRREYRQARRPAFCPPPVRRYREDWCDWGPRVLRCAAPRIIVHRNWRLACEWDDWRTPLDAWGDRVCFTVREPVQLGQAEIWCDDGEYRTVDFEGRWFEPGTYVLVDFHGGRHVADVRLQARSRTAHGDFSLFLALGD